MENRLILFDANGPVGTGTRNEGDFKTCADLLRHMDRLGIARALVWSVAARDWDQVHGNRELLKELESLAMGRERGRLVPSLVISPAVFNNKNAMRELFDAVSGGKVRALRIFPSTIHYKLHHLEPLLEKVRGYKPVILVDIREIPDDKDLIAFAGKYHDLKIICLHGMWPELFRYSLLDILRRCPNVLIDNSWLHCHTILDGIVKEHGAERVVFATGFKSHNGASIANLSYADIGADERQLIGNGNLEQLLGMPPLPAGDIRFPAAGGAEETFWHKFLQGQKPGVDIIDAHGHFSSRDLAEQAGGYLSRMDALGIKTMIISDTEGLHGNPVSGNRNLEANASKYGGRFLGYFVFNCFYDKELLPLLDDCFSRKFFVGFKTLCDYWDTTVTDRRFAPAYKYAQEHRLPILFHTWNGNWDSPAMLKGLVRDYPDAVFILGHSGGGDSGREEAEELAAANKNVYLEWCGSFCSRVLWERTLSAVDAGKVVFGTDAFGHDIAYELGRFMSLDLPFEKLVPILGENIKRILEMRR